MTVARVPLTPRIEVTCPLCSRGRSVDRRTVVLWLRAHADDMEYRGICKPCAQDRAHEARKGKVPWNKGLHGWMSKAHQSSLIKATKGRTFTEEDREKLRQASTGRKHTEETQAKLRYYAQHRSEEHRRKIAIASIGRKQSVEQREQTRLRMMGNSYAKGHRKFGQKHSEATCKRMSELRLRYYQEHPEVKERIVEIRTGTHLTEVAKEKIRNYHKNPEVKVAVVNRLKEFWSGSDNPRWLGGISYEPYSYDFNEEFKELIRDREGRKCRLCGNSEDGRKLDVHHIDYDKKNTTWLNAIALDVKCHIKTNRDRQYWQEYLTKLVREDEENRTKIPAFII